MGHSSAVIYIFYFLHHHSFPLPYGLYTGKYFQKYYRNIYGSPECGTPNKMSNRINIDEFFFNRNDNILKLYNNMDATDSTRENYLEHSFNRWFALMSVKRGKNFKNQSMEECLVVAQKESDRSKERDLLFLVVLLYKLSTSNFHTVRNSIFNNPDGALSSH